MLLQTVKDVPVTNWIIWVGAGISFDAPSGLPLGGRLTEFALRQTCDDFVPGKIFTIWEQANRIVSETDNPMPLGPVPRLETVLGDISDVQLQAKGCRFDFMSGFGSLLDAPYNENHMHLALLLSRGATIITTNFDTCIEKAYRELRKGEDELTLKREGGVFYYTSEEDASVGRLWHIHGVADNPSSLGTTVRTIKEGIPSAFQRLLDKWFRRTTALLFIGYSASDSFDVNLYFSGKKAGEFKKSVGVFVQHGTAPAPLNAALVTRCFKNHSIENHDTTQVLRGLTKLSLAVRPRKTFDWEGSFRKKIELADKGRVKDFIACKIAFSLGLNINVIDPLLYRRAVKSEPVFDAVDFHKTLALLCRLQGATKREKGHDDAVKKFESDMLGFHYAQGNFREAFKRAKSVEELFQDAAARDAELDWSTYTSMSVHCRSIINKYLMSPFSRVSGRDMPKIARLLELTYLLGSVPLKNVTFINQVATALRFRMLFLVLINAEDDREIDRSLLYLYGEGASVVGFVSAYRDIAIKYFFLFKYHRRDALPEAVMYTRRSLALARLTGDVPGKRLARKLLMYFRIFSPLKSLRMAGR
jgi:hypothetical protein